MYDENEARKNAELEAKKACAAKRKELRNLAEVLGKRKPREAKRHVRCKKAVIHTEFNLKGKRK